MRHWKKKISNTILGIAAAHEYRNWSPSITDLSCRHINLLKVNTLGALCCHMLQDCCSDNYISATITLPSELYNYIEILFYVTTTACRLPSSHLTYHSPITGSLLPFQFTTAVAMNTCPTTREHVPFFSKAVISAVHTVAFGNTITSSCCGILGRQMRTCAILLRCVLKGNTYSNRLALHII